MKRTVALGFGVIAACAACAGCGKSTTAPSPIITTVSTGNFNSTAHLTHAINVSTGTTGRMDISVSWVSASNTLRVQLTDSTCSSDQLVAGVCHLYLDDRTTVTTAVKNLTMPSLAPGSYLLLVDNRGPTDDVVNFNVTLTH